MTTCIQYTVLGGNGRIGSRVAKMLRESGHVVEVPMRDDSSILRRPLGRVIYSVGLTADFRKRPLETVEAHVCLLQRLLCHGDFQSLVYLSSTRVYAGAKAGHEEADLTVNPHTPTDLYNVSKLMGESLCLHSGRHDVRIARVSNVVGGAAADSPDFIPTLVRHARAGRIVLESDLQSVKDYIHLDDVSALVIALSMSGNHRVYNVGSGQQTSNQQWAAALEARYGCTVDVVPNAPLSTFPPVDIRRIQSEFGFNPSSVLDALQ